MQLPVFLRLFAKDSITQRARNKTIQEHYRRKYQ